MFAGQRYFIRQPIALIGFMGSGKTSVAKLLSEHTGIKSVDTDDLVVQTTKQTVSEIINKRGENEFRAIEAKVLSDLIEHEKCIIATGGGIIESAVSRGVLKNCFCVWLKVDAKTSAKRIEDFSTRPMFKDIENAENLIARRNEIYEQYSDVSVNTNGKPLSNVVKEVRDCLLKAGALQY